MIRGTCNGTTLSMTRSVRGQGYALVPDVGQTLPGPTQGTNQRRESDNNPAAIVMKHARDHIACGTAQVVDNTPPT